MLHIFRDKGENMKHEARGRNHNNTQKMVWMKERIVEIKNSLSGVTGKHTQPGESGQERSGK